MARSLVWGSASLGSRPDSRSESDSYSGWLGSGLALGWLGSEFGMGAWLNLALGLTHAQRATLIRAGLARSSARLGSVSVLAGSVPDSTWLKTLLSARLG